MGTLVHSLLWRTQRPRVPWSTPPPTSTLSRLFSDHIHRSSPLCFRRNGEKNPEANRTRTTIQGSREAPIDAAAPPIVENGPPEDGFLTAGST